jgi:hypothetical protein
MLNIHVHLSAHEIMNPSGFCSLCGVSIVFEVKFVLQIVTYPFLLQQDLYVYLSESEKFNDFGNPEALIWSEKGLVYGDWSSGSDGDGTRVHNIEFETSEVISVIILSTVYPEFLYKLLNDADSILHTVVLIVGE